MNRVLRESDMWGLSAVLLLVRRHVDRRSSEEIAVSIFRTSPVQHILWLSSSETHIATSQSPQHIVRLKCSGSRLCHKVGICSEQHNFLRCRKFHKGLFSIALELTSRMCLLYVTKHQILEADIISSSRRWTFVSVLDHKSQEPWSLLTSSYYWASLAIAVFFMAINTW